MPPEPPRKEAVKTIISLNKLKLVDNEGPFNSDNKHIETLQNSPKVATFAFNSKNVTPAGGDGQHGVRLSQTLQKKQTSPIKHQD